jgi:hypothetical protein
MVVPGMTLVFLDCTCAGDGQFGLPAVWARLSALEVKP